MGGIFSSESRNNSTLSSNNSTMVQFNPTISLGSNGAVNPYNSFTPTNSTAQPTTNTAKDDIGLTANVPLGGYNLFGGGGSLPSSDINPSDGLGLDGGIDSGGSGLLDTPIDPMILIIGAIMLFVLMGDK